MKTMKILATLDANYLEPLRVMLLSLFVNNPGEEIEVWILHRSLSDEQTAGLENFCTRYGASLRTVGMDGSIFDGAPETARYPQEMYYRLLAHRLLPADMGKILYLDPDILVINPLRTLWETDTRGCVFAAAPHFGDSETLAGVNKLRLGIESKYFNSGVLLIDLTRAREEIHAEAIFQCVRERKSTLLLPDQDILNLLYGNKTLELDDTIWNYDARYYAYYLLRSAGQADLDWVMRNTAILHFCGGNKPWKPGYRYRFGVLYKHYAQIASREDAAGSKRLLGAGSEYVNTRSER